MKRPADPSTSIEVEEHSPSKTRALEGGKSSRRASAPGNAEMGEFEDDWEDDLESEEEVEGNGDSDAMEVDGEKNDDDDDEANANEDVFLPGTHTLGKDEVLEPDQSVYEMLHRMDVSWPCLSFDVLRDNLGDGRQRYPATTYIVSGTQADHASKNELLVMKMSQLHKTQKDDGDSDSENEDNDGVDDDAILEHRSIPHFGGVNRVRARPLPPGPPPLSDPYHVATWADTGKVHVWDVRPLVESLDAPGHRPEKAKSASPIHTVQNHGRTEGFALDWSPPSTSPSARLLSGDLQGRIYLTTLGAAGFNTAPQPFASHTQAAEDLQWSPSEATVFASCSSDQSVRVWDIRVKTRKNVVGIMKAHDSDVNVITWNRGTTYLLASGGDEGGIKIWDLRNLKGASAPAPSPVAAFTWHTAAITSIEWHPTEDSIFAASGADDQVTLWDLSVEQDEDETGSKEMLTAAGDKLKNVPPQLLFVHQGQKEIKEIHWHQQIPGCVISTASDGFNVFKTISV